MSTEVKPTDWDAEDNMWEPTASGGSSLPSYTSADEGKVLGLAEDAEHTETVVVVPEQTVTTENIDNPVPLIGENVSAVSVGMSATMTVDGVAYEVVAVEHGGYIGFPGNNGDAIFFMNDEGLFQSAAAGSHTVSLTTSVPSVEPKWEVARGLTVHITKNGNSTTADHTFEEVDAILQKGGAVNYVVSDSRVSGEMYGSAGRTALSEELSTRVWLNGSVFRIVTGKTNVVTMAHVNWLNNNGTITLDVVSLGTLTPTPTT